MSAPARSITANKSFYGVYPATVSEIGHKDHPGEVRLTFPWFDPSMKTEWCRVCNLYAGNGYGSFFHPEKDDEVLVAFIQGDMRQPIVLGGLYNGQDKPPTARTADKDQKLLRTKGGHEILMDDTAGQEKIVIVDKSGENRIEIDSVSGSITITAKNTLTLSASNIEITAQAGIKVEAGATLDLKGSSINLN